MRDINIEPVIQEEKTGCGIACCTALAGTNYQEVKLIANSIGIYADDKSLWSDVQYVRTLLNYYKIEADPTESPFLLWDELPDLALLSIKWHQQDKKFFWHWVVFWRSSNGAVVLDSKKTLKNHIRRDFGRIKPKWYIPVKLTS